MNIKEIITRPGFEYPRLTIGDIAEFEDYLRKKTRSELIAVTKELYGDKIPADSVREIEKQAVKASSFIGMENVSINILTHLIWRSLKKVYPEVTLDDVMSAVDIKMATDWAGRMFPDQLTIEDEQKKTELTQEQSSA